MDRQIAPNAVSLFEAESVSAGRKSLGIPSRGRSGIGPREWRSSNYRSVKTLLATTTSASLERAPFGAAWADERGQSGF